MLALDASPPGPLDAYERRVETLQQTYPNNWSIISFADETNRTEEWPAYREEIEDEVERGCPPAGWDPLRPWAAVILRAANDD